MPNFVKIAQSVAKILRFFRFFKMAAAAILNCRIHKILLADSVWRAQTHHSTKFHQNRSFNCGHILQFFEFSRWPPLPCWIFEIAKFYWLIEWRGLRRISMPNFVKIDQSVATTLRFFRFFKMAAAAILDCRIHKISLAVGVWRTHMHHCTKCSQNRSIHNRDIAIFQILKLAAAAILDF